MCLAQAVAGNPRRQQVAHCVKPLTDCGFHGLPWLDASRAYVTAISVRLASSLQQERDDIWHRAATFAAFPLLLELNQLVQLLEYYAHHSWALGLRRQIAKISHWSPPSPLWRLLALRHPCFGLRMPWVPGRFALG